MGRMRKSKKKTVREQKEELRKSQLPKESIVTYGSKRRSAKGKNEQRNYIIMGAIGFVVLVLGWWLMGSRGRAVQSFANNHGFELNQNKDRFLKKEYLDFGLLHRGGYQYAYNVFKGKTAEDSRGVVGFDYAYTETTMTKGKKYRKKVTEREYLVSAVVVDANTDVTPPEQTRAFCPTMVRPAELIKFWGNKGNEDASLVKVPLSYVAGLAPPKDSEEEEKDAAKADDKQQESDSTQQDEESTPVVEPTQNAIDFNDTFLVRSLCSDAVVESLLTEEVLAEFLKHPEFVVDLQGDKIMIFQEIAMEVADFEAALEHAQNLLKILPHVETKVDEIKANPPKEDEEEEGEGEGDEDAEAKAEKTQEGEAKDAEANVEQGNDAEQQGSEPATESTESTETETANE